MSVYSSEKENDSKNDHRSMAFIDEKLFKSRCLTIFGEINDKLAALSQRDCWRWPRTVMIQFPYI